MIYKTLHRKLKIERYKPHQDRGELGCSGRESSFCSFSTTRRVSLVTNQPCDKSRKYDGKYIFLFGFLCTLTNVNKCLRNIKYIVLFLDHPNENIPIEPQIDDQLNLRLNTTFRKVFPKPICQAHINVRYLFIVKPPTQILYTK